MEPYRRDGVDQPVREHENGHSFEQDTRRWDWNGGGHDTDPDPAHDSTTADVLDGAGPRTRPDIGSTSGTTDGVDRDRPQPERPDVIVYPTENDHSSWSGRDGGADGVSGAGPVPVMDADEAALSEETEDTVPARGAGTAPATGTVAGTGATPAGGLDAEPDFRQRWREIQAGFVDDPQDAVRQADQLVEEAVTAIASRREALAGRWKDADRNDTEQLRLALRDYRSLLEDLVGLAHNPAGDGGSPARHEAR
ncbi:hypothetical protein [Sphaerisporangium fuscum]|uniref:hypothetical protein n=1 Tax=Sphaerisporangium fuscum TaxID=2835868 RepID=UPI001BDBE480|nr:hypothetical protein [Sphaerisporangium fuscum]